MKFISPFVYLAVFLMVVVLNFVLLFGLNILVTVIWPDWYIESDNLGTVFWFVGVILSSLLVFGSVFLKVNELIVRLENLQRLTLLDHFRHCTFLYVMFVLLGLMLLAFWDTDAGLEYGAALLVFLCSGYAILLDTLTSIWKSRRLHNTGAGELR